MKDKFFAFIKRHSIFTELIIPATAEVIIAVIIALLAVWLIF